MPDYEEHRRLVAEEKLLVAESKSILGRRRWSRVFLMTVIVIFLATSLTVTLQPPSPTKDLIGDVSLVTYLLLVAGRFAYEYHLMQRCKNVRLWAADLQRRLEEFHYRVRGPFYGE